MADMAPDSGEIRRNRVSLKIEAVLNKKQYAASVASIKGFETAIHRIGDYDPQKNARSTHFAGVYKMMAEMAFRSEMIAPLYPAFKKYVQSMNAANFASNGLPVGGWAPLEPRYAAWKAVRFPGAPTMVATGKLFNSLTTALLTDRVTNNSVEFATPIEYAKFHQYGTTKMPKRKIVYEPTGLGSFAGELIGKWVARNSLT